MPKIHLLPDEIISKIAAGEVIERPASAVKELLENSLDAQSSSIEIHLKQAGKTLIQVKDNGGGIEADDIEKVFLRHSTSKIGQLSDLYHIESLGFRGRRSTALPRFLMWSCAAGTHPAIPDGRYMCAQIKNFPYVRLRFHAAQR